MNGWMSDLGQWWCECEGEHDCGKCQGSGLNDSLDVEVRERDESKLTSRLLLWISGGCHSVRWELKKKYSRGEDNFSFGHLLKKKLLNSSHIGGIMPGAGFPGGSDNKDFTSNAGGLGLSPGLERSPGGGHGNPSQYSWLENPHRQRSLEGCRPWGSKVSDTTERLEHTCSVLVTLRQTGQKAVHSLRSRYLTTPYALQRCVHTPGS